MRVQLMLKMVQYPLHKEEYGELLDQQVHVITPIQEIWHRTRNFVRVTGDYLGLDGTIGRSMDTWPCHIDRFENQYNKV